MVQGGLLLLEHSVREIHEIFIDQQGGGFHKKSGVYPLFPEIENQWGNKEIVCPIRC